MYSFGLIRTGLPVKAFGMRKGLTAGALDVRQLARSSLYSWSIARHVMGATLIADALFDRRLRHLGVDGSVAAYSTC